MEKQQIISLDLVTLQNMVTMFPSLLERIAALENELQVQKKNYKVKMLTPEQFMKGIDISRNTFENWKRDGLFQYTQRQIGAEVKIPATEVDRINNLCIDVPKKLRREYLNNLKTTQNQ